VLAKSKNFNKNQSSNPTSNSNNWLYTQASKGNIKEIIKIKNAFLKLFSNKIMEIYNTMNNTNQKGKQKFNMITKGPSRKQIIIPMSTNNSFRVIAQVSNHISNINRLLKGMKSESLLITSNPVTRELLLLLTSSGLFQSKHSGEIYERVEQCQLE